VGEVSGVSPLEPMTSTEECLPGVSECIRVEESPVSCYLFLVEYPTEIDHWALWLRLGTTQEEQKSPEDSCRGVPGGYIRGHVRVGRTHSPFEPESS